MPGMLRRTLKSYIGRYLICRLKCAGLPRRGSSSNEYERMRSYIDITSLHMMLTSIASYYAKKRQDAEIARVRNHNGME